MVQLIPENTSKKVDSLGRITLPKGLRARLNVADGTEMEFFTLMVDGQQCIVMKQVSVDDEEELERAIELLDRKGYEVSKRG